MQDDSGGFEDYEVHPASSGDSDDTDEEEMVEVCEGQNTLYFHSRDGMGNELKLVDEFLAKFLVRARTK